MKTTVHAGRVTRPTLSPEERFLAQCKSQNLRPVFSSGNDGAGIALDHRGRAYANLGAPTFKRTGVRFDLNCDAPLEPVPLSMSVRIFRDILNNADCGDYHSSFSAWMRRVEDTLRAADQ